MEAKSPAVQPARFSSALGHATGRARGLLGYATSRSSGVTSAMPSAPGNGSDGVSSYERPCNAVDGTATQQPANPRRQNRSGGTDGDSYLRFQKVIESHAHYSFR